MTSTNIGISENRNVITRSEVFSVTNTISNSSSTCSVLSSHFRTSGCETGIHRRCRHHNCEKGYRLCYWGKTCYRSCRWHWYLGILAYHWREELGEIYFSTEQKKREKTKLLKWWNIGKLASTIPQREYLLFFHAWSGCDTILATYKKGELMVDIFLTLINITSIIMLCILVYNLESKTVSVKLHSLLRENKNPNAT